ncbi:MAG: hypothetical protein GW795_14115 [Cyanobacteria bacterium]|nr:hypothetical protein [Cyanobacteria bacterium CG_2015-16_32_12]NCO78909.1 hypothetical protein [Cyanobacteria bacterium CG_2015-22_32_23]NCQ04986.1 hypothetical protein [Cyanobacteria bacterium CG_2015-09_32_10]NCQ42972.1 hypothetical protein [Cyanobacteria bacterium CG_2015-04_32_10]NCS84231.1 hypothetical protein [Cyanobacteria bacterium CG_2015-02_32_10]
MGLKALFFLITIIITVLFYFQNLQPITLVFFGFKSPILPLSLWFILSLCAGILSSLIIQLLANNPTTKQKYNQSFSSDNPYNYPPSTPEKPFINQPKPEPEKPFINQPKSEPKLEEKPISPPPINEVYDPDFDFDFEEELITENNQEFLAENESINLEKEKKIETSISEEIPPEKQFIPVSSKPPSEAMIKTREASPYSYKPKEKTKIIPPSESSIEINNSQIKISNNRNKKEIYDAPYRVISPAYDEKVDDNYDDLEEEEEDWDF